MRPKDLGLPQKSNILKTINRDNALKQTPKWSNANVLYDMGTVEKSVFRPPS